MALKKHFLHPNPEYLIIPKLQLFIGFLLWIFSSVVLYSFFYIIRARLRYLSIFSSNDLWILSDKEMNFYNLFFAFIAVIFAQSITFNFWFDKPKKMFAKRNYRKNAIVNDQRFLNLNFLYWFSKVGIAFGLYASMLGVYRVFSLYPDYNYFFILIVIVLFFQTWTSFRFVFKRRSVKWLLLSVLVVSITSFGLSKINLIDYHKIDETLLQNNVVYKYKINLPETDNYKIIRRRSLIHEIYVANSDRLSKCIVNKKELTINEVYDAIKDWKMHHRFEMEIPLVAFQLFIDQSVKMSQVNKLKQVLIKAEMPRIIYAVKPENNHTNYYDKDYVVGTKIPSDIMLGVPLTEINKEIKSTVENIIEIKHNDKGDCYINNSPIAKDSIKNTLYKLIKERPDYIIKFYINDQMDFGTYLKTISAIQKAVYELRNEYSLEKYAKNFGDTNDKSISEIKKKIPIRCIEITTEMLENKE